MAHEPFKPVGSETIAPFTYPDTLLRAQRQTGAEGLDIALFGLPYDGGTIARETDEALDWAAAQGITMIDMDECEDLGPKAVAAKAREVAGGGPVYVTLDVDGVDPADMPGTGSPEPGGLRMRHMQVILRGLRGLDIVGGDVNEVSPSLDPTGYTAFNAAHLMFEILCLMGENRAAR
jgi:guanidinopropionase